MWTKLQFENAATKIGEQFVNSEGAESINDLATKVAQDAGLNPDGIRTMVRLANVTAFERLFEKRAKSDAEDRMIEFEVGDPEVVINKLHSEVKEAVAMEKTASDYSRQMDYYGDLPQPEVEPLEKTASAVPGVEVPVAPERSYSVQEVKYAFERAASRMEQDSKQAEYRWLDRLEKVARSLISIDGTIEYRTSFEKNAASLLGEDVLPELKAVHSLTSPKGTPPVLFGGEKVASIIKNHIANVSSLEKPIMDMVKEAHEARVHVERCKAGLEWISNHMPGGN